MSFVKLFIAVNFNDKVKEKIFKKIELIKEVSLKGRFVEKENLHLTLVFLGEVDDDLLPRIIEITEKIQGSTFNLELSGLGKFQRKEGDILWLGVVENPSLNHMVNQLETSLRENGLPIEKRPYIPHITLGRKVRLKNSILDLNFNIETGVDSIEVMESTSRNGKLEYLKVYSKKL